ncbi:hypothetical protein CO006_00590 [Candidatus Roizmanbacteria bacterium CG_4_8_14_3_um_filter_35_14]|nr:MAG: hypothetical protein CO006_00590 [Candidatus Roizmanbacteria bacterium CG_4_8_14_3_um_filter_35_14]
MKEKDKQFLKFHSKLYSLENLKKAIKDYEEIVEFRLIKGKDYNKVEIKILGDFQDENIGDEFKNYALFLNIQSL